MDEVYPATFGNEKTGLKLDRRGEGGHGTMSPS